MLTHSFEDLAQSFRILLEAHMRMPQLIKIDRAEAVGNLDNALTSNLNAFHNLYDLMSQTLHSPIDWYATQELCTILAIRNARHHNLSNRIRSLYNYHLQNCESPTDQKEYLFVDFSAPLKEGGGYFNLPISWHDIQDLLSLPRSQSRLRKGTEKLIRKYIQADAFEIEAENRGFETDQIVINYVPLMLNAGIVLQPYIKDFISPSSTEANAYLKHFEDSHAALTQLHKYESNLFFLPD